MEVPNRQVVRRFLMTGPIVGAVFGALIGGIAWGLSEIFWDSSVVLFHSAS